MDPVATPMSMSVAPREASGSREPRWRRGWALAIVLVVATSIRAAMLAGVQRSLYAEFLFADERTYDTWARALVEGGSFQVYDQSSFGPRSWFRNQATFREMFGVT